MARKSLPRDTQKVILTQSRRRCCLCFGLSRDVSLTQGQIAHLDHNSSNHAEENLAFLCLAHHDQYDSITSQSKNLTMGEVKHYRSELTAFLKEELAKEVLLKNTSKRGDDPIEGYYIRTGEIDSAEIKITRLAGFKSKYHISGFALWGRISGCGQNTGAIDFSADFTDGQITYVSDRERQYGEVSSERRHRLTLIFRDEFLSVIEANWLGVYGMNVTLQGEYRRVS